MRAGRVELRVGVVDCMQLYVRVKASLVISGQITNSEQSPGLDVTLTYLRSGAEMVLLSKRGAPRPIFTNKNRY